MKLPVFNYSFPKNQSDADVFDVYVDGDIVDASTQEIYKNWYGDDTSTSYKSFRDTILNSGAKRVNIHFNSGGGMMSDAFAMHDFIKENIANGKDWHTHGKGMVASAATYPLLAGGDNMHISENCFFMIHNASGGINGSVDEIESYANTMRKFNNCARDLYATTFNKPKETISNWMNAETWWTGTDMKNMGLISEGQCGPAENAIKNSITKEKWLFQNQAILNTINNSIPKPPKDKGMKKNKIATAINDAFAKFFTNNTTLATAKPEDLKTAIIDALNTQDDDEVDVTTISNAVTTAMAGEAFNTAVANAVNKMETVPKNITEAITNATKDVATKAHLDKIINDISDKLGTQGTKNVKPGGKPKETEIENEIPEHLQARWGDQDDEA